MTNPPDTARERADFLMIRAQQAGITDHKELAIFMGQAQVETGNFRGLEERLGYSAPRLLEVFRGRNGMDTLAEARTITEAGPRAVANAMYGGAWGKKELGNTQPDDGWTFRGRGYLQVTGRDNYGRANAELKPLLGEDLIQNPDALSNPENAAASAIHYWETRVVAAGVQNDVVEATRAINPGLKHLQERRDAAAEWERKLEQGYQPRVPEEPLPARPIDPRQPVRSLFESIHGQVEAHERERGIGTGTHTSKLALALEAQALRDGLVQAHRVEFNDRGTHARAVQFSAAGDFHELNRTSSPVEIASVRQRSESALRSDLATGAPEQRERAIPMEHASPAPALARG